ncbi:MAG: hypothetical protein IT287_06260 [Bdellovibrionaceae bacterium]|nr:hypothetical protein [Pseudobdellovibrionaceae bacterium]
MRKKLNILITSAFFFVILISYQNCGTGQQGSLFDKQTYSTIPYELAVDQIAYMSCAEQGDVANDQGMFFTFRAGAYGENAGVRVTEDFLYETRRINNQQRMDILFEDPGTALSRLQFSVRRSGSLNSMFVNESTGGNTEEIDFDYVFGDFGSDEMSASLLTNTTGAYLNYWSPAGVNRDAYFEGTLVYNSSESLAQQVRQFFAQDGVLTLAYADTTKPENIRSPAYYDTGEDEEEEPVTTNQALGLGFKLAFKQPLPTNWGYTGSPHVNMPKRVLQSIFEYNLETPGKGATTGWSCPKELQMRILFPDDIWEINVVSDPMDDQPKVPSVAYENDVNFEDNPETVTHPSSMNKLCPQRNDSHPDNSGNADLQARLAIIRRSLPVSDWYVNLTNQCIIPKRYTKGSCYGIDNGTNDTRSPEYNVKVSCDPTINSSGVGVCTHFFSLCYK